MMVADVRRQCHFGVFGNVSFEMYMSFLATLLSREDLSIAHQKFFALQTILRRFMRICFPFLADGNWSSSEMSIINVII